MSKIDDKLKSEEEENVEDEEEARKAEEEAKKARLEKVKQRKEEAKRKAEERKTSEIERPVTPPTPPPSESKAPIREDLVIKFANFLQHPRVKNSPMENKTGYLKQKGLTEAEIQEVFKRSGTLGGANTTTSPSSLSSPIPPPSNPPPPSTYAPPPPLPPPLPPHPSWNQQVALPLPPPPPPPRYGGASGIALAIAGGIGLGVGVTLLAEKYLLPLIRPEVKKPPTPLLPSPEEEAKQKVFQEMLSTLKMIQQQNSEMKDSLKSLPTSSSQVIGGPLSSSVSGHPTEKESERTIQEMQAQIKNLKAMLLDMKSFPTEAPSPPVVRQQPQQQKTPAPFITESKPSIPAWQSDPKALSFSKPPNTSTPPNTSNSPPKTPETEENYPKDFGTILQMVRDGQKPPGIQDIDDSPIDQNAKVEKGTKEIPLKPWEKRASASGTPPKTTTTTTVTSSVVDPSTPRTEEEESKP